MKKLSALETGLGTAREIGLARTRARLTIKSDPKSIYIIIVISPNTAGEQFELRNLESFDPMTQELYR
jgi:hypothetical protein